MPVRRGDIKDFNKQALADDDLMTAALTDEVADMLLPHFLWSIQMAESIQQLRDIPKSEDKHNEL